MGKKLSAAKRRAQKARAANAAEDDDVAQTPTHETAEGDDEGEGGEVELKGPTTDPTSTTDPHSPTVTNATDLFSPTAPSFATDTTSVIDAFSPTESSFPMFASDSVESVVDTESADADVDTLPTPIAPITYTYASTDAAAADPTTEPDSASISIYATPADGVTAASSVENVSVAHASDEPNSTSRVHTPTPPTPTPAANHDLLTVEPNWARRALRASDASYASHVSSRLSYPSPTPSSPTLPPDERLRLFDTGESKPSSRAPSPLAAHTPVEHPSTPAAPKDTSPVVPAASPKLSSPVRPTVNTTNLNTTAPSSVKSLESVAHIASPGGALHLKLESSPMVATKLALPVHHNPNPMPSLDEGEEIEPNVTPATSPATGQLPEDSKSHETAHESSPTASTKRMSPPVPSRSTKPKSSRGHSWGSDAFPPQQLGGTLKTARQPSSFGDVMSSLTLVGDSNASANANANAWGQQPQPPPHQPTTDRSSHAAVSDTVPPLPSHLRPSRLTRKHSAASTSAIEHAQSSALDPYSRPTSMSSPPPASASHMAYLLERSAAGMSPLVSQMTGGGGNTNANSTNNNRNSSYRNSRSYRNSGVGWRTSRNSTMLDELAWKLEHSPGAVYEEELFEEEELQEIPPEEQTMLHSPMHRDRDRDSVRYSRILVNNDRDREQDVDRYQDVDVDADAEGYADAYGDRDEDAMSTGGTGSLPLRESLYSPRGGSRQQRESVYSLRGPNKYRYTDGDSTHTREILETMRGAMATLTGTFDILHEQSTRVAALGPPVDSAAQIQSLRRRVRAQDKRQERRVGELKRVVREVIKDQIAEEMRAQIAEQIRTEMAAQVRSALAVHMGDTPADLRATAQESMRGLVEVRVGLQNSEARRANSILRASNLDEPLATVLLASGKPHELFPGTLRSLFAMDGPSAKTLVQAYDLPVADQREKNLNRFMTHIGLNFNVVPVGVGGHGELMDDGGVTLGITAA